MAALDRGLRDPGLNIAHWLVSNGHALDWLQILANQYAEAQQRPNVQALACGQVVSSSRGDTGPALEYSYSLRIVAFNAIEGWSRDATQEVADALADRAAREGLELPPALRACVQANASLPFGLQLALHCGGCLTEAVL